VENGRRRNNRKGRKQDVFEERKRGEQGVTVDRRKSE
jgi:hypothetical protein